MIVAVLLLASSATALAGEDELRKIFAGRYAAMKSAMADRDPKAIAELLAPEFVSEDVAGKTKTGNHMIDEVCALPKDPYKASTTTILSVKTNGEIATVTQKYHMTTIKKTPDSNVKQAVELDAMSTDTWKKSKGMWLLSRTETMKMDYKIDGKSVVHKERQTK